MGRLWTRRRTIGALVALTVTGALGASVALRLAGRAAAEASAASAKAPVALEFAAADLTRVAVRPLARWLPVSGTVQPLNQATVKAKVSGDVLEIRVREGESVRAGQLLARIDTADLEARLAEKVGALEAARAQLALAEKTRASNQALLRQNFISQNAYDNSESTLSVSRGALKSAQAQVQLARNALRDAVVASPLDGVVARRHVQPGEKVAFDSPLLTIVDLRRMELQAVVPAGDVPELAIGMPVELAIDGFGERRFAGRIERINPSAEPGTRAILVYVSVPNHDASLRGGMFATGRIALAPQASAPTLPQAAVRSEAGQTFVWAIDGGRLVRRIVLVGRRDDAAGRVEVTTPLPRDLPILAAPFDNLKEGAPALVKAGAGERAPAAGALAADGRPAS